MLTPAFVTIVLLSQRLALAQPLGAAAATEAAQREHAAVEEGQRGADEQAARETDAHARAQAKERALAARGLDARVRALCDALAVALKRLPGDHRDQRFAVLPFSEAGDDVIARRLGAVVSDLVVTSLARDHRLPLVERVALAKILDEQALGQIGALADGQAADVGKIAGARALIIGAVSDDGNSFRVALRAVDTESAVVVEDTVHDVLLPKDELIALSADAVVLKSRSGAMFRSLVVPGWGQAYNDEPVKAGVVLATVGTLAAGSAVTAGLGAYLRFVTYEEIGTRPEDKDLSASQIANLTVATRQSGEVALIAGAVLAGVTLTAWGLNVVDAYISGTDVESLDAALAR